jgi:hypothetical protein
LSSELKYVTSSGRLFDRLKRRKEQEYREGFWNKNLKERDLWNEPEQDGLDRYCKGKAIPIFNYVIKHCAMKAYEGIAPPVLTSALDGGE